MNADELYRNGKLPLKYYNQLNDKSPTENYNNMRNQFITKIETDREIEKTLYNKINEILDNILTNYN